MTPHTKQKIIAIICFYNAIAALITIALTLVGAKGSGWQYLLFMTVILLVQLISAFGLWKKNIWGWNIQFLFYFLQSFLFQSKNTMYSLIIGPHFYLNLNFFFSDGQVVMGFNVIAIIVLIMLAIVMPSNEQEKFK